MSVDAIMSHFREDCVFEAPRGLDRWGRRFVGREEVRRGVAARFEGIPDVHYGRRKPPPFRHAGCGKGPIPRPRSTDDALVMTGEHRDRVLDWRDELRRLEPDLPLLPPEARRAVRELIESFQREEDAEPGREGRSRLDDAA